MKNPEDIAARVRARFHSPQTKTASFPPFSKNGPPPSPEEEGASVIGSTGANSNPNGVGGRRNIPADHQFDPRALKPMSKALFATSVGLGHALTAYRHLNRLKSATVSPDGMLGGRGYIMAVKEVRQKLYEACESLSAIADTLYDEIKAPHWESKLRMLGPDDADDVSRLIEEAQGILSDPEDQADEEIEKVENDDSDDSEESNDEDSLLKNPEPGTEPEEMLGEAEPPLAEGDVGPEEEPEEVDPWADSESDDDSEDSGEEDSEDDDSEEDSDDEDSKSKSEDDDPLDSEESDKTDDEDEDEDEPWSDDELDEDADKPQPADDNEEAVEEEPPSVKKKPKKKSKKKSKKPEEEDIESSRLPSGGPGEESEAKPISTGVKQAKVVRRMTRVANSSLPVDTLSGPRVEHLDPGEAEGPHGSWNPLDDATNDDWGQENWGHSLEVTSESMTPSDSDTPTEAHNWGLGDSDGDGDAIENRTPWGPHSGLPGSPPSSSGDFALPGQFTEVFLSQRQALLNSLLPNDLEEPVARSDYYSDGNSMLQTSTSELPDEGPAVVKNEPSFPNTFQVQEDTATPYVHYDNFPEEGVGAPYFREGSTNV